MKLDSIRQWRQEFGDLASPACRQKFNAYLVAQGLNPTNIYQDLEMTSRYVDTHPDVSDSNGDMQLHSHGFYELLYCCNTCGVEYLVGAERYRVQKGDIIFVAPGVSHRPLLPEHMAEPYTRYVLWLSTDFLRDVAAIFFDPEFGQHHISLLRTAGTKWEILEDYFHCGIQEAQRQAPGWEAAVVGNTMVLLTVLRRAILDRSAVPLRAEKPELLDQVMAYIEAHLSEKISLSDTAKHFYVSESTISHVFRQKMDVSFYHCVTQRRLIASKTLIREGNQLESVSRAVGFSDYSTFYRAFKQEYGISPRQFMQMK